MIAILFAISQGKMSPHCSLAVDGDVYDRKSRRFAIAILVLSASGSWLFSEQINCANMIHDLFHVHR